MTQIPLECPTYQSKNDRHPIHPPHNTNRNNRMQPICIFKLILPIHQAKLYRHTSSNDQSKHIE